MSAMSALKHFFQRRRYSLKSKQVKLFILFLLSLAEELLSKESIGLPDIIRILGNRPFPMKESVREYLEEMLERKDKEDKEAAAETPADAANAESKTEQGEALNQETPLNIPKEGGEAQGQKDQEKKE